MMAGNRCISTGKTTLQVVDFRMQMENQHRPVFKSEI